MSSNLNPKDFESVKEYQRAVLARQVMNKELPMSMRSQAQRDLMKLGSTVVREALKSAERDRERARRHGQRVPSQQLVTRPLKEEVPVI